MNFDDLMKMDVQRLYDMEVQLTDGLMFMSEKAQNPQLKQAFDMHRQETMGHSKRLEQIAQMQGFEPGGEKSHATRGLIKDTENTIGDMEPSPMRDAALIGCAQKAEHMEISAYGTARELAMQMGLQEASNLFQQNLDEEKKADQTLTQLAESGINRQAVDANRAYVR